MATTSELEIEPRHLVCQRYGRWPLFCAAVPLFLLFLVPTQPVWSNSHNSGEATAKTYETPQKTLSNWCSYSLSYENDQVFTDRNYTFGGLLTHSCSSDSDRPWLPFLREWNEALLKMNGMFISQSENSVYSHYGGLSLYTPNSLKNPSPGKSDGRPYASLFVYGDSVLHTKDSASIRQEIQLSRLQNSERFGSAQDRSS